MKIADLEAADLALDAASSGCDRRAPVAASRALARVRAGAVPRREALEALQSVGVVAQQTPHLVGREAYDAGPAVGRVAGRARFR